MASNNVDSAVLEHKLTNLESLLRDLAPVALGFSGGVDSTFLAAVCARAIPDQTLLVHLDTPFAATPERASFSTHIDRLGLPAERIVFNPFSCPDVTINAADRCYRCKLAGFSRIIEVARQHGCQTILDGSNADDAAATDRPGMRALHELSVRSPLMETGWTKAEERKMLRAWDFDIWNMPSGACLATRVVTGEALTEDKINAIRTCEDYLHDLGCVQIRARISNGELTVEGSPEDLKRIAAPDAMLTKPVLTQLSAIATEHGIGSVNPTARLYRRGSMNR